jgi:hypothetical protein
VLFNKSADIFGARLVTDAVTLRMTLMVLTGWLDRRDGKPWRT